jgi:periplasmic protein TonB
MGTSMFEDSLVESRVAEVSPSRRWTMLGSIGLQIAVAGVVIALPLLHPEALPFRMEAPKVLTPLMPRPAVPAERVERATASSVSAAVPVTTRTLILSISRSRDRDVGDAPPLAPFGPGMRMSDGSPIGVGAGDAHGPVVSVAAAKAPAALQVSKGVLLGMLMAPIRPVYPVIAKAAGVQGSVVVEAVISREGRIESLHVVSGPAMLESAATDAIREARYKPYRLNGEPTEVRTTITVNFRLGG